MRSILFLLGLLASVECSPQLIYRTQTIDSFFMNDTSALWTDPINYDSFKELIPNTTITFDAEKDDIVKAECGAAYNTELYSQFKQCNYPNITMSESQHFLTCWVAGRSDTLFFLDFTKSPDPSFTIKTSGKYNCTMSVKFTRNYKACASDGWYDPSTSGVTFRFSSDFDVGIDFTVTRPGPKSKDTPRKPKTRDYIIGGSVGGLAAIGAAVGLGVYFGVVKKKQQKKRKNVIVAHSGGILKA